jgi:hypothetical protein
MGLPVRLKFASGRIYRDILTTKVGAANLYFNTGSENLFLFQ